MDIDIKISKSLSYWLRHKPEAAGLTLDAEGWTGVDAVLTALKQNKLPHAREDLDRIIADNSKQRFELSDDGLRIRARQGHSVAVALNWPQKTPPANLYHGTVERYLEPIMADGLKPMGRHHVHLSPDIQTAQNVGSRRGKAIILTIDAAAMADADHAFYLTANGVWLTEAVPTQFLTLRE